MAEETNRSTTGPGTGAVPGAGAERVRMARDDAAGIAAYLVMVLGAAVGIIAIVALG